MSFGNTAKDGSGSAYWLLVDSDGHLLMVGAAAHDAPVAGNPLRSAGVYRSTPPAVADGDVADLMVDAAGRQQIVGAAAHDAAAAGNPLRSAGVYRATLPTVTDGDVVDLAVDAAGRLLVKKAHLSALQVTADGNIKASAGKLHGLVISGAGVTAGDKVEIKDGVAGSTLLTVVFGAANETINVPLAAPISFSTAIYADVTLSGGAAYVTGIYE